jgi:hypothetical protein
MERWAFLLDLLHHLGFTKQSINWVSVLLSTASMNILVNGQDRNHICHARDLKQGDPPPVTLAFCACHRGFECPVQMCRGEKAILLPSFVSHPATGIIVC